MINYKAVSLGTKLSDTVKNDVFPTLESKHDVGTMFPTQVCAKSLLGIIDVHLLFLLIITANLMNNYRLFIYLQK